MEVTRVKVRLTDDRADRIKANVYIIFDNCFLVDGVKVVEGNKGLFVAMPSHPIKRETGIQHQDIAHPINAECRKMITDAVMTKYNQVLEKAHKKKVKEDDTEMIKEEIKN